MQDYTKNKKNFVNFREKGFSFVEVIVAVSIIMIMSMVGFSYFRSNKSAVLLDTAQRELASALRLAQSYSLQGKTQDINGEKKAPCGYGLRFEDAEHYQIFYNEPPVDVECEELNSATNPEYFRFNDSSISIVIEEYGFNRGVSLSEPADFQDAEIYFVIPHGNVYDNGTELAGQKSFSILEEIMDKSKRVNVDRSGLISED